jgi:hypothetical protein
MRSVSATRVCIASAGWQQVKISRTRTLGGRDRLVGWDLGVAVSQGFLRLAVDDGGRVAVGAGR